MYLAFVVAAGGVGAILASFLDVVADRLPRGVKPLGRSHCEQCGRVLSWFELVPIVSWIALRGRCRSCGATIPVRHLVAEVLLAISFALTVAVTPHPLNVWLVAIRLFVLCILTIVVLADLRYFIIPDTASLGLFVFASVLVVGAARFVVPWTAFVPSLPGALWGVGFGALFLGSFALISRGTWMGWGDVKLIAAFGMLFGFPSVLFLIAFSFMFGALAGLSLIAMRRKSMQDLLPFGPFLVFAALPFLFGFGPAIERFFGIQDFLKTFFS